MGPSWGPKRPGALVSCTPKPPLSVGLIAGTSEVIYRKLHKDGIGASVKHTSIITIEEEKRLWQLGIMSIDNPKGLQRAVIFYIGKLCCLRGGEEQRLLKVSQFQRSPIGSLPDKYT